MSLPLCALLLSAGGTAPASAAQSVAVSPSEPERWDWIGAVVAGKTIRIENPFGDVRTRFGGSEGKVEIHAVIQNFQTDAAPLKVSPLKDTSGLTIRVGRSAQDAGTASPSPGKAGKERSDRIDLALFLPKGIPVTIVTRSGDVEVRGLKSDVRIETDSGGVNVRGVEGLVNVTNRYGTTLAMLDRPADRSEQSFESLTGDITVSFHPAAEPLVKAETSGEIGTEVSIEISRHPHDEPNKTALAKVGRGTSTVSIRSKRGNIHIQQREDLRTK